MNSEVTTHSIPPTPPPPPPPRSNSNGVASPAPRSVRIKYDGSTSFEMESRLVPRQRTRR